MGCPLGFPYEPTFGFKFGFVWGDTAQKPKPAAISENMRSVPRVYRPPYSDESSEVIIASRPTIQTIIRMARWSRKFLK